MADAIMFEIIDYLAFYKFIRAKAIEPGFESRVKTLKDLGNEIDNFVTDVLSNDPVFEHIASGSEVVLIKNEHLDKKLNIARQAKDEVVLVLPDAEALQASIGDETKPYPLPKFYKEFFVDGNTADVVKDEDKKRVLRNKRIAEYVLQQCH